MSTELRQTGRGAAAMRLSRRSVAMLVLSLLMSAVVFGWPLLLRPGAELSTDALAPMLIVLVVPLLLAVVSAQVAGDAADVKALALLGVMSALVAILRPLGAGTAGMEAIFFPIILSGRVFGPGFGFVLGNTGLFASALLTAGVGPWLPYQMLAAGLMGLAAGLLPPLRGRWEIAVLAAFAFVGGFAYGWLMDFAFWPFNLGLGSQLSYDPADPVGTKLHKFVLFNLATSMGWNFGRSLSTALLVVVAGRPTLRILRRAARRASFD